MFFVCLFLFVCFFEVFVISGLRSSRLKLSLSKEVGEDRDEKVKIEDFVVNVEFELKL